MELFFVHIERHMNGIYWITSVISGFNVTCTRWDSLCVIICEFSHTSRPHTLNVIVSPAVAAIFQLNERVFVLPNGHYHKFP